MRKSIQHVAAALFLSLALAAPSWGYEKEIDALSVTMAQKIASKGKTRVAVVDFADLEGNVRYFDKFIAEQFSVALSGAGKGFRVIDRSNLNSLIKEHKLSATGMINPATAMKLGKIAGADALVTGTLTPISDNVQLIVKVLDANTADIIDSAKINIARTQAVNELLGKEIAQENPTAESTEVAKRNGTGKAISEVKGFAFNVKECKKSGGFLTCSVSITSSNNDKQIKIYANYYSGRTVIYDNAGNEYAANKIATGEQAEIGYIERRLVANVPTKYSFEFKNISQDASTVALFEIKCLAENEQFVAQFRNIPISK
ncbi:FlgO family outer membrane protein [Candidatus Electronema sp. TJ]|uniref:FlgO family outer membrane protein n=1 Tax=Candidatus Electronema sp. TJ TaxID=3401573 RepID=UPI003AA8809E